MRPLKIWLGLACLAAMAAFGAPADAQQSRPSADQPVIVAVRVLPPFVQQQNGAFVGFSIDLWDAIAQRLHLQTKYVAVGDVHDQLEAVSSGHAGVGVGAISITAARDAHFDFSQPILNSGLQILTKAAPPKPEETALQSLLHLLFGPAVLVWLGIAVLLTIVPAHILWFIERNEEDGLIRHKNYFPGIFQAFFWGLGTLATQADAMPRHWLSRIVAILWMFTGIVFVAFYTAQLTATLTTAAITGAINGPGDLPGKRVGTIQATTSADYLRSQGLAFTPFATPDAAVRAVIDGKVDAVVYDGPVLQYYAAHDPESRVRVAGLLFHREDYGFAFRNRSQLRKRVDTALLELRESGDYDKLVTKWFGAAQ